ncbi:MAG: hypothetical protein ACUVTD_08280 [Nitrososphaerales archaeon]
MSFSEMLKRMVEKNLETAKRMAKTDKKYEEVVKELEAFLEAVGSSRS